MRWPLCCFHLTTVLAVVMAMYPAGSAWCQEGFESLDVGSGTGTTLWNGDTLEMTSTGEDVWGEKDAFRFVFLRLNGDVEVRASISSHLGPDEWAKAGLMLRDGSGASARFVDLVRTRDHGLEFQSRPTAGADVSTIGSKTSVTDLPVILRIQREGTRVTASYRYSGRDWEILGVTTMNLPDSLYAGFVVTSGDGSGQGTARFLNPSAGALACVETKPDFILGDLKVFAGSTVRIGLEERTYSNPCSGPVTFSVAEGHGTIESGEYVWTADAQGSYSVSLEATNLGGSSRVTFVITVLPADQAQPRLKVDGRFIRDESGEVVILRGLAVADLRVLETSRPGWSARSVVSYAHDEFGANVVRLTVHPSEWLKDPSGYLEDLLVPVVELAMDDRFYVIIDWHYIADGNLGPLFTEVDAETQGFWSTVADRFAGNPNVLFELFNEPAQPDNWSTWKATAQPWIDLIRERAPDNLLLVSGLGYSSSINRFIDDPFVGDNLVYVGHVYPDQAGYTNPNPQAVWEANWGRTAEHYPVIVSEWGFENVPGHHWSGGTRKNFGEPLRAYIESKGMSWTAWCFDNIWGPRMFDDEWRLLTGNDFHGGFVRDWIASHLDANAPVLWLNKSRIDFPISRAGLERTETLKLANVGQGGLVISLHSTNPQFAIDAPSADRDTTISVGDTVDVVLRFLSPGGGAHDGELTITHNAVGGQRVIPLAGFSKGSATPNESEESGGNSLELGGVYPNPFTIASRLRYSLPASGSVRLRVVDMFGRQVRTLVDEYQHSGVHEVSIDAAGLASGLYAYVLETGSGRRLGTMTIVK